MFVSVQDPSLRVKRARVWLNGDEVTDRCFAADDVEGYVDLHRYKDGKRYQIEDQGHLISASERRYGTVRIELPEDK